MPLLLLHMAANGLLPLYIFKEFWNPTEQRVCPGRCPCVHISGLSRRLSEVFMLSSLIAYFIIPSYTLLFVSSTNWFTLNLSVLGSRPESSLNFLLLGLLIGLYYRTMLGRILARLPYPKVPLFLLNGALVLLFFAVSTPYLPARFPMRSFLHVVFAFIASMLLLACMLLTVKRLAWVNPRLSHICMNFLINLILICAALFIITGIINTAMEVIFLLSTTIMTQLIYKSLQSNPEGIFSFPPDHTKTQTDHWR